MKIRLNSEQRKTLSDFFKSIAIAWYVGLFVIPKPTPDFDWLTVLKYLANIIGMLVIALLLVKEEK